MIADAPYPASFAVDLRRLAGYQALLLASEPNASNLNLSPLASAEAGLALFIRSFVSPASSSATAPSPLDDTALLFVLLARAGYPHLDPPAAHQQFHQDLLASLESLPRPRAALLDPPTIARRFQDLFPQLRRHPNTHHALPITLDIAMRVYYLGVTAELFLRLEPPRGSLRADDSDRQHRPDR